MAYPPPMHAGPMPAVMVPYIGMIPGGLMPGKKISIHGQVVHTCSRFAINLQCGPHVNPRDDIALHMSFRYDVPAPFIVRNSLQMLQWGLEEAHGYLSFGKGHNFEVTIHVEHDHYKIYLNGHHFTDFRYRIPLMRVNHLAIDGEVVIYSIKVDGYEIHAHQQQQHQQQQPYPRPPGPFCQPQPQQPYPQHAGSAGYGQRGMIPPAPVPLPHVYPVYPVTGPGVYPSAAIPIAAGMGVAAGASMMAHDVRYMDKNAKKAMKKQKKEMKKAMKHHKHAKHSHGYHHHGGHHGKSSSSSSSSSEEE